ncbi:unnamed protein product [Bursaphelenchus xylophilus]|uniref:(pine wood nematode) hypothetical protein n=1 Tax=Bursaphelenchus xylophilus TaxID=6326 RepID=A0A1I7SFC1_BURXY|nr:unnamed protein product [Bursaphelenchus xylophilus]CAG9089697.1 unnamed protein product [Bursaphelenchus xylophilus]
MVGNFLIFLILFANVFAREDYLRLAPDCSVVATRIISTITDGPCTNLATVYIDKSSILILRVKDSKTIEYATLDGERGEGAEGSVKMLKFYGASLEYALGDDCSLRSESLSAFMDFRTLYIKVTCGHVQAFVRSVVYSTKMIYTPPGVPIYVDANIHNRLFGIAPSLELRQIEPNLNVEAKVFEIPMEGGDARVRMLTRLNSTGSTNTPFEAGSILYSYWENEEKIMVAVKRSGEIRFGYFEKKIDNFTEVCEPISGVGNSLFFCFLDLASTGGGEYTWMRSDLVNDEWFSQEKSHLPNLTEPVQQCSNWTHRRAQIVGVLFPMAIAELTFLIVTILIFSCCALGRKKKLYKEYTAAKLE